MFDFVALDFETATKNMDSACSIGIVAVKDFEVVDSFYSLIKPPKNKYDSDNIAVHHITPEMTADAPTLTELWMQIGRFFDEHVPVLAHNANFDMSALRLGTDAAIPNFPYVDTMSIASNYVSGGYSLANCVAEMGITLENHHNALKDAEACAQIAIKGMRIDNCLSLWEYIAKGGCRIRYFYELNVQNTMYKRRNPDQKPHYEKIKVSDIHQTVDCIDTNNPLCGKNIVFTGELSISREDAMQIAVNCGAAVKSAVSGRTDFLVVGEQDKRLVGEDGLSSKEERAYALNESGKGHIKFLSEDEFIALSKSEPVDQYTNFTPSEAKIVQDTIKKTINDVLIENWLDGLECSEDKKKNSPEWSYKFQNTVVAQLYYGPRSKYITIPGFGGEKDKKVDLNSNPPVDTWVEDIKTATVKTLEQIPKDFSCCSHYAECSDAKRCIHPDKNFALGCFYRKQMVRGKIFYGENRNID